MRYKNMLRELTDRADLPGESLARIPLVELSGDSRVLIENHAGITEYTPDKICVSVQYGCLCVCGRQMVLSRMSSEQLVISGYIQSVTLCRRGQ